MGDRNNAANTAATFTEFVTATAFMRPIPRWFQRIMPLRLQPFVSHHLVYSGLTASCTPLHPPHLSHDNRLNRHVAAHIPITDAIAAHPMRSRSSPQRFKIARSSLRVTPCAQSPLLMFADSRSQLHTARPRSRPGGTQRHRCLRYNICLGYWSPRD